MAMHAQIEEIKAKIKYFMLKENFISMLNLISSMKMLLVQINDGMNKLHKKD